MRSFREPFEVREIRLEFASHRMSCTCKPCRLLLAFDNLMNAAKEEQLEVKEILEGVLVQAGYTCMGAYEDVESYLGVEWSREKKSFVYPDGTTI